MDETSLLIEAIKVGGAPSALVVVLWVFINRWFATLNKELDELKTAFGEYRVKTEQRITRCESKLDLQALREPERAN